MFENYIATKEDLDTVIEGMSYVYKPELDFIFKNKDLIASVVPISFDSKYIYIFSKKPVEAEKFIDGEVSVYRIEHKIEIVDRKYGAWQTQLREPAIKEYLPADFKAKVISGGFVNPFLQLQQNSPMQLNPYTTRESYLATIVHEYGHAYYNAHHYQRYFDLEVNLNYIQTALNLHQGTAQTTDLEVRAPVAASFSELFAYCTDYSAASIFWPKHKEDLDKFFSSYFAKLLEKEKAIPLETEDSVLQQNEHTFASVIGTILLVKHGNNWPEVVLSFGEIK